MALQEFHRRRQWHPTPVLLPGKSHGWRSLVGCSPWGHEELDERLHFHFSLSSIGEGNGNPLQFLAWRIPGTGEPGGLHRVGDDWSDLAAATGIPLHPLALLTAVIPKAHLTLHSRLSDSGWLMIPLYVSYTWYQFKNFTIEDRKLQFIFLSWSVIFLSWKHLNHNLRNF